MYLFYSWIQWSCSILNICSFRKLLIIPERYQNCIDQVSYIWKESSYNWIDSSNWLEGTSSVCWKRYLCLNVAHCLPRITKSFYSIALRRSMIQVNVIFHLFCAMLPDITNEDCYPWQYAYAIGDRSPSRGISYQIALNSNYCSYIRILHSFLYYLSLTRVPKHPQTLVTPQSQLT